VGCSWSDVVLHQSETTTGMNGTVVVWLPKKQR